jgi:hypothetical protein
MPLKLNSDCANCAHGEMLSTEIYRQSLSREVVNEGTAVFSLERINEIIKYLSSKFTYQSPESLTDNKIDKLGHLQPIERYDCVCCYQAIYNCE